MFEVVFIFVFVAFLSLSYLLGRLLYNIALVIIVSCIDVGWK